MVRMAEFGLALLGFVIAVAAFAVGWQALNVADQQLRTSNQLTAVTLYFDQWRSLIDVCISEQRAEVEEAAADAALDDQAEAVDSMLAAVEKVTMGDPPGAIEAFLRWRDESACLAADIGVPVLALDAFALDDDTLARIDVLQRSESAVRDTDPARSSPGASFIDAAIQTNLELLADRGPVLSDIGVRSSAASPAPLDVAIQSNLVELARKADLLPGVRFQLPLASPGP